MTKLKQIAICALATLALSGAAAFAQFNQSAPETGEIESEVDVERELAVLLAPIKSKQDLDQHLTRNVDSPINNLPLSVKWQFLGSLVFNENGLASFNYDILERHVSPTEAFEVLSLFGVQHTVRLFTGSKSTSRSDRLIMLDADGPSSSFTMDADHKGYYCESRANCRELDGYICMSSC